MQFCKCHWDSMRQAVEIRGMSHLVAKSGKQTASDAAEQIKGTDTLQNWDPLMAAHWAIFSRVLEIMGLAAMGDICPLCEVEKGAGAGQAQIWTESCMDAMLDYAREHGLAPKVQ